MLLEILYHLASILHVSQGYLVGVGTSFIEFVADTYLSSTLTILVSLRAMFLLVDKFALLLDADAAQRRRGYLYAIGSIIYAGLFLYNQYVLYQRHELITGKTFNTNTMNYTKKKHLLSSRIFTAGAEAKLMVRIELAENRIREDVLNALNERENRIREHVQEHKLSIEAHVLDVVNSIKRRIIDAVRILKINDQMRKESGIIN